MDEVLSDAEVIKKFSEGLEELTLNDKIQINKLTYIARDYKSNDNIARTITKLACKKVLQVATPLKLVSLYVIDSILKNIGDPYKTLFMEKIVECFVHSFQNIRDEKGRIKLYNLRITWKEIFPNRLMYDLDTKVHVQDPNWPIVAKPNENKGKQSLDKRENEPKESSHEGTPPKQSRDPRLKKKLTDDLPCGIDEFSPKKLKTSHSNSPNVTSEQFLIDRSGDDKMEKVALKKGREELKKDKEESLASANSLFGQKDQDMRSPKVHHSLFSPSNRGAWSSYRNRHSEIASRRSSLGDVDMRKCEPPIEPFTQYIEREKTFRLFQQLLKVNPNHLSPSQRNELMQLVNELSNISGIAPPPMPMGLHHMPRPPLMHVPPIKSNNWKVEVYGLTEVMPDIGIDPRLLNIAGPNKPTKTITIDGCNYTLILDRLQPLIMINGQLHAVRYQTRSATFKINARQKDMLIIIPSVGYRTLTLYDCTYVACLGGPGHELIIDGVAHNVPLNNNPVYITIGRISVEVQFMGDRPHNVDVLPPIPPQILKWAAQHLFGSAKKLYLPPSNPLQRLARLRAQEIKENSELLNNEPAISNQILSEERNQDTIPKVAPASASESSDIQHPAQNQPLDIYELFNKLVAAGIVKKEPETQNPPEMSKYSLEKFKLPFEPEETLLYKGYQCMQCGLRFEDLNCDEYKKHLDYHYVKNATEEGEVRSRNYFQSVRHWLISDNSQEAAPHFDEIIGDSERQVSRCKAFEDSNDNVCAVCFEKFDTVWDDEEEDWMLLNAIFSNGKVYHPICLTDADKQLGEISYSVPDDHAISHNADESYTTSNELQSIKEESNDHNASQKSSENSINEDDGQLVSESSEKEEKSPETLLNSLQTCEPNNEIDHSDEHTVTDPIDTCDTFINEVDNSQHLQTPLPSTMAS